LFIYPYQVCTCRASHPRKRDQPVGRDTHDSHLTVHSRKMRQVARGQPARLPKSGTAGLATPRAKRGARSGNPQPPPAAGGASATPGCPQKSRRKARPPDSLVFDGRGRGGGLACCSFRGGLPSSTPESSDRRHESHSQFHTRPTDDRATGRERRTVTVTRATTSLARDVVA
jgi:hypothetical protein